MLTDAELARQNADSFGVSILLSQIRSECEGDDLVVNLCDQPLYLLGRLPKSESTEPQETEHGNP